MDGRDFVAGVYGAVFTTAVRGVRRLLEYPPGRSPAPDLASLSDWYGGLNDEDAECVRSVIRLSVDQAVFGFLAVLDGVRAIDSVHTELTLHGAGNLLNGEGGLHNEFRALADSGGAAS